MSDVGKSVLEDWFAAGDAGDFAKFDEYLHPDVVVHAPLGLSTQGIDAERNVWRAALAAIPDLRHEVQEVIVDGDRMAARLIVTGTLHGDFGGVRATGAPFEIDQIVISHLRDGKAAEVWEVADVAALLRDETA